MSGMGRALVVLIGAAGSAGLIAQEPAGGEEPPAAFAPLAHLAGAWKGQAAPAKDRLRGWVERHEWAWGFDEGRPVALELKVESGKPFESARLAVGEEGLFRLETTSESGEPANYEGTFEPAKGLVLERVGTVDGAAERLTIRPNSNRIRYVVWVDRKEKGAPSFRRSIEMNLGREGVNFAAGGATPAEECVVTGGAAGLTVTHEGKSYPLCCTGCREQFLADPEKYIARAKSRAEGKEKKPAPKPAGDDFDDGPRSGPTTKGSVKP